MSKKLKGFLCILIGFFLSGISSIILIVGALKESKVLLFTSLPLVAISIFIIIYGGIIVYKETKNV